MAKQDKIRQSGAKKHLDYQEGKIQGKERNAFERDVQKDPFEAEAMEGFSKVERDEAEGDLALVALKIRSRIKRRSRITWYSAAAAIASILVVTTIFFQIDDSPSNRSKRSLEMSKAAEDPNSEYLVPAENESFSEPSQKNMGAEAEIESEERELGRKEEIVDVSDPDVKSPAPMDDIDINTIQMESDFDTEAKEDISQEIAFDYSMEEEILDMEDISVQEKEIMASEQEPVALEIMEVAEAQNSMAQRKRAESIPVAEMLSGKVAGLEASSGQTMIKGVVLSSENLSPVPGASVILKGSSSGAITDTDGNFQLEVEDLEQGTLITSFIGMESEETRLVYNEPLEIIMEPSTESLDEVVVVGYSESKESNRSTSGAAEVVDIESSDVYSYTGASPENGMSAFKEYIDSSLVFPPSDTLSAKAIVVLKFLVSPNGIPGNIKVIKSPSNQFSEEAIRVLIEGPNWIPAEKNGTYLDETVRLRVVFREEHRR